MAYTFWSVVFGEQPSASKWNILGTNDAGFKDGSNIDAGAILPNHLLGSSSSNNNWDWDTWASPIASGLSVGTTGTIRARYMKVGKIIFYSFEVLLGGTGISVGDIILNLPVTAYSSISAGTPFPSIGYGICFDGASTEALLTARLNSTTQLRILPLTAGGTYTDITVMSSTVPLTWGAGDSLQIQGFYEGA